MSADLGSSSNYSSEVQVLITCYSLYGVVVLVEPWRL